jgi:hypothetical protein
LLPDLLFLDLAGYVRGCTFSMVVNNAPVPASVLRKALDDIALAFGLHPSCDVCKATAAAG